MARDRAKINTGIWGDPEWKSLNMAQQWLYTTLLTRPELNHVGVGDWRPKRLAKLVAGVGDNEVEVAAFALQVKRFVLVDEDTEEVLIRSFLKHDGVLDNPNLGSSIKGAYDSVFSPMIQAVIVHELSKLAERTPDMPVLKSEKSRRHIEALLELPSAPIDDYLPPPWNGDPNGVLNDVGNDVGNDVRITPTTPSGTTPTTTSPTASKKGDPSTTTTATTTSLSDERERERESPPDNPEIADLFEQWWKHYPKKVDKGQARKAFKTALSKTDITTLTAGVTRYAQSVASTEPRYIKNPSTWLNAEAWDNQPDPEPERPKSAWDYGPEAYMHPEEIEYERRAAAGGN